MDLQLTTPITWTIAGSDTGGGAGIQADLKVMNAFGVHGCSVITALTAQNTCGVERVDSVSPSMFRAQLAALKDDLPPLAIKTGMLGRTETCTVLAEFIQSWSSTQQRMPALICDPVLKSTSGTNLLSPEALQLLKDELFPYISVLTPNLPETEVLLGEKLSTEKAAEKLLAFGSRSVLIKGGHSNGLDCSDYWTDGKRSFWMTSPRVETRDSHGTGCILSSAIAASMALGQDVATAVLTAKTFLNQCLKSPSNCGAGHGPMIIKPFLNRDQDQPIVD